MLKIGEFAQEADVTVKTLRHYDKLDLLKPTWIDRFNGYRYYAPEQLPRLNRIMALKDLGFSLEQIGRILQNALTLDELRGMLRLKHAELEQHIKEEQARLARIKARLHQIEQEDDFLMSLVAQRKEKLEMEPEIVTKPAFTVVGLMYFGEDAGDKKGEISQMWQRYMPRVNEIKGKLGFAYGGCGDLAEDGRFHYMAGHEVEDIGAVPEGFDIGRLGKSCVSNELNVCSQVRSRAV